jgi:hypothetical protein
MLAAIVLEFAIRDLGGGLGHQSDAHPGKGVGKGNGRFQHPETKVPGTDQPLTLPIDRPIGFMLRFGKHPI